MASIAFLKMLRDLLHLGFIGTHRREDAEGYSLMTWIRVASSSVATTVRGDHFGDAAESAIEVQWLGKVEDLVRIARCE